MTSTTNPSTMLADALAQFSKATYNAFTEVETRAASEAQGWKQEAADAKAALAQAELKVARQTEAIAQLRREVRELTDQSRNWQNHFLRVEQERCTQSSRIDELLKLQYTHPINTTLFTPKPKHADTNPHTINSAPSALTTKGATTISSPTQPPSYKSAALSNSDTGSCSDASSPLPNKIRQRQRDIPLVNPSEEAPQTVQHRNPSSSKRKNKGNNPNIAAASSSQRQDPQNTASHTTLIRRVQAVVHIKQESDDDSVGDVSGVAKDEAFDEDEIASSNQRRSSRRSRKIVKDDEENVEQNYLAADGSPLRNLRHRNGIINYREDDEDEDDVDELMMGAEGAEMLGAQLSKPPSLLPPPPKKRRKLAAR